MLMDGTMLQNSQPSATGGTSGGIEVRNVNKTFKTTKGSAVQALSDINLKIDRGSFISLIGPSGCGKSTLLKSIGGLIRPESGDILVDGKRLTGPINKAAFVFQNPVLLPWRTVLSNVLFPLELKHKIREADIEAAMQCLKLVGLEQFSKSYPYELSGGMQQRAGIARALVQKPDILLMDEPFGALDAMTREGLNVEISQICADADVTTLFVTHSIPEAVMLSDRVVVMGARPGHIKDIVEVPLPQPRSLEMTTKSEFSEIVAVLRRQLNASGVDL